ncbi:hypothetical protein [Pararhizobium sp. A13]|uniref:hypothetical protein n=1 Tax=Pararhizobium sp. A13 TaxID=3133975 RepID=UPI0032552BFE
MDRQQNNDIDEKKGDEVLRRMLKTPPQPDVKPQVSKGGLKQKPGGNPAKNNRPEDQ